MAGGTFSCGYTVGGVKLNYAALAVQDSSMKFNYDIPEDENYDYSQDVAESDDFNFMESYAEVQLLNANAQIEASKQMLNFWFNSKNVDAGMNGFVWVLAKDKLGKAVQSLFEPVVNNGMTIKNGHLPVAGVASFLSITFTALFNGFLKMGLEGASTGTTNFKTFWKGFIKDETSGFIKLGSNKASSEISKSILKSIFKNQDALNEFLNKLLKKGIDSVSSEVLKSEIFKILLENSGVYFGVDYIASLTVNLVMCIFDDEKTFAESFREDMKWGSTALKSAIKAIFTFAGTCVGHPKVGTAVGAFVGDFADDCFKNEEGKIDEKACAIATGTTIAGALGGLAFAAFCVSNPIGWFTAGCVVAGAVISFAFTAFVYNFDKINTWVEDLYVKTKNIISWDFSGQLLMGWGT